MKKQRNVFRVPNVRVGSEVKTVRFKILRKQESVKCATKGHKPFVVSNKNSNSFFATQRGNDTRVFASSPEKAFAQGVKTFWSM